MALKYGEGGAFLHNTHKIFNVTSKKCRIFDAYCFEETELRFLKSILGVHRKSSHAAVRGELGKYPGVIFILRQVLKNWMRLANYDGNSLLHDIYLCNINMVSQ